MRINPINTNTIAFRSEKKKNDSEVEEVAALSGGAVVAKATHEISKINTVATQTGNGAKKVGNIITKLPGEAKNYQEGLTLTLRRFLKNIHLEKLMGKGASKFFGAIGGLFAGASAIFGITEAAGAYSQLIVPDKK